MLHVGESEPLRGWRMWGVAETQDGPRLVAPFISAVYRADPSTPGVSWQPGTNTNSTYGCPRKGPAPHPRATCRCGIRAVQSLHPGGVRHVPGPVLACTRVGPESSGTPIEVHNLALPVH